MPCAINEVKFLCSLENMLSWYFMINPRFGGRFAIFPVPGHLRFSVESFLVTRDSRGSELTSHWCLRIQKVTEGMVTLVLALPCTKTKEPSSN
jgi:hypothetical protein